jgi:hypothetical protein
MSSTVQQAPGFGSLGEERRGRERCGTRHYMVEKGKPFLVVVQ